MFDSKLCRVCQCQWFSIIAKGPYFWDLTCYSFRLTRKFLPDCPAHRKFKRHCFQICVEIFLYPSWVFSKRDFLLRLKLIGYSDNPTSGILWYQKIPVMSIPCRRWEADLTVKYQRGLGGLECILRLYEYSKKKIILPISACHLIYNASTLKKGFSRVFSSDYSSDHSSDFSSESDQKRYKHSLYQTCDSSLRKLSPLAKVHCL